MISMQPMLRTLLLVFALCMAAVASAQATDDWNPRSGDAWVDATLADINRYGTRYHEAFVDEIVRYQSAPRALVQDLLERGWLPGDVYFACALAQAVGRPCRYVADAWERDRGEGWGALAKRLGAAPGSPQFHRLKRGLVPSYERWGRPLQLDPAIAAEFPGRTAGAVQDAPRSRHTPVHETEGGKAVKPAAGKRTRRHDGGHGR